MNSGADDWSEGYEAGLRAARGPRCGLVFTSLVEIVRGFGGLAVRCTGSTLDGTDAEERAAEIARDVLDGLDTAPGVECILVVRGDAVIARYDLAALALLADLLHLLAADAEIARAA